MGAGATVFSALYNFDVRPTDKIAIVGLGGVGHLTVQFAHAWGCEVTVLSTSTAKRHDAFELGASKFTVTKSTWTESMKGTIDVLLMVASIKPDKWEDYISILKPRGKIILVTAGSDTLGIPVCPAWNFADIVHPYNTKRISIIRIPDRVKERNEFDARVCGVASYCTLGRDWEIRLGGNSKGRRATQKRFDKIPVPL